MRLPNSYGSVVKLSGKRRRPYAVRLTTGWSDDGKQIQKYVSYHERRSDAIKALADYNQNPYDVENHNITFSELYQKWCVMRYPDGSIPNSYAAAYKRLPSLYDMEFISIRKRHIQHDIDCCHLGFSTKKNMKTLCNLLFKYAIDLELVTVNMASSVELPAQENSTLHKPFTKDELAVLWNNTDDIGARYALILCYTGMRPTELLKIQTANVHLQERYLLGGIKTAAGKNRVIPIAEKIFPLIAAMYNADNKYLAMDPDDNAPILTYDRLRDHIWERSYALQTLPTKHLPGDCRHTCASMLDDAEVQLKTTQLILGHRSANITHRVYTHKTISQLIKAINLI